VDIKAEKPITIFLTSAEGWNQALQHPEAIPNLQQLCTREHVMEAIYVCDLPPEAMTLVIRDERNSLDPAVFAGLGAVLKSDSKTDQAVGVGIAAILTGQGSATRRFTAPNDVHIQYFRWTAWKTASSRSISGFARSKRSMSSLLPEGLWRVYAGHDGEQVSIKIKSPVPMVWR